ncbi:hypothetical protein EYF80_045273 [Liparis tanakae]|uniref:Uncharacterized protein n=1 Tax=Liparis tanakae TaxID=230148 RepID=A0A4Z2FUH9_9TELE|nr:hypothetical protein EYF80_045273 [Liparis tanakae]
MSGGRYQSVTTSLEYVFVGMDFARARPKNTQSPESSPRFLSVEINDTLGSSQNHVSCRPPVAVATRPAHTHRKEIFLLLSLTLTGLWTSTDGSLSPSELILTSSWTISEKSCCTTEEETEPMKTKLEPSDIQQNRGETPPLMKRRNDWLTL